MMNVYRSGKALKRLEQNKKAASSQKALIYIFTTLTLVGFAFLLLGANWMGYKEDVTIEMILLQALIGVSYIVMLFVSSKLPTNFILTLSFVYITFFTFIVQQFHSEYWGTVFPPEDLDGAFYHTIAAQYMYDDALKIYEECLSSKDIGDWGFTFIVYSIYHFFTDLTVASFFLTYIFNPICVVISSYCLYRTISLVTKDSLIIRWVVSIFVFFPYFFLVSAVGRKENVFVLLVSVCLFHCMRYTILRHNKDLFLSIAVALTMIFFRPPITVMFLISIVISIFVKPANVRALFYVGGIVILMLPLILDTLLEALLGISLDQVLAVSDARNKGIGQDKTTSWSIQFLSALLGPFPNFTRSGIYGIFNSIGLLLKCLFPLFVYKTIPHIFKNHVYYMLPVLSYFSMGIVMLTLSGVALDLRYHITFFPALLLLFAYSLAQNRNLPRVFWGYLFVIMFVIVQYNLR